MGLIFLFGYTSYAAAAAVGCSGILAIFVAGILESHYHIYSLTEAGRLASAIALKALAHLFEVRAGELNVTPLISSTQHCCFGCLSDAMPCSL